MDKKYIFASAIVASSLAVSVSSYAAAVYSGTYVDMYLKQNTFPAGLTEEMIFLDAALASSITGHVGSQSDSRLVTFSSTTDMLNAANGFSTIKADDGYLNNITITAPGYWFEDLIFSVNIAPNQNDDLSITATDKSGGSDTFANWTSQSDWVNGNNRIMAISTSGNLMQSVTINSNIGFESFGGLDQLKQTEISGFVSAVPVPAAVWLLGSSLIGFVGFKSRSDKSAC